MRGVAILGVLCSHWAPEGLAQDAVEFLSLGSTSVQGFFVLSSFLITSILADGRDKIERKLITRRLYLMRFLGRRSLRIFPIYYLTLLVTAFLLPFFPEVRGLFVVHAVYLTGFYMALADSYAPYCSHLWSLAVEEHFYLVWPLVVLLLPRSKAVLAAIVMLVASCLVNSLLIPTIDTRFGYLTIFSHLHSFGVGALLAFYGKRTAVNGETQIVCKPPYAWTCFPAAALFFVATRITDSSVIVPFLSVGFQLSMALVFAYVIRRCIDEKWVPMLDWAWLQGVGRISYCLYLVHPFVPRLFAWVQDEIGFRSPMLISILFWIVIAFCTALMSWYFVEKPLLSLKKHLE